MTMPAGRALSAALQTAIAAETVRPAMLVYLDLPSGAVRVNSTIYSIDYDGNTYTGVGDLGRVGTVQEATDFSSPSLDLILSGLNASLISAAYTDRYQGRDVFVYLAFLDGDHALVDAFELFAGRIDYMQVQADESTVTITVRCENELVDWERPKIARYNDADQQARYPGDLGLEYVPLMVEREIVWGR